jgi:hypothetical protein
MRLAVAIVIVLGVAACTRVVDLSPFDALPADAREAPPPDAGYLPDAGFLDDAAFLPDADIGFPDAAFVVDAGPLPDAAVDARP